MLETHKAFSALSEEFVECSLRHDPVLATTVGIHDYDERYPDDTPEGFQARATWLRDLEQRLAASVVWEELPTAARVDYALLRSQLAVRRAQLEEIRTHARNAVHAPETALRGVMLLMTRPFAPLDERKEAVLARMMAVPAYLEGTRRTLEQVPAVFLETAREVNKEGPGYVEQVVRTLTRSFPGEAERIEHAGSLARVAFAEHQDWLERELPARVGGDFAIGERWMDFRLEKEHLLNWRCGELEAFGRDHVERTRRLLEDEARRLDPALGWREQIGRARRRHPEPAHLREAYAAEVERARRFLEEKRFVPVPEAGLEVVDTPVFMRATTPFAAYMPPAPFDLDDTGWFWVTPVEPRAPLAEQAEQLGRHAYAALTLITVHEAWPGHHLQLVTANRVTSRLRHLAPSVLFDEGWALYGEELMHEQGYYVDPVTRLWQLKELMLRACRVVIDVGLHTGRMTLEQAAAMLGQEAMIEPDAALAEVRRYALEPTQPMSYLVGKELLLELRAEMRRRLGTRFDLAAFHAALLASGSIPPALVREELAERLGA